MSFTYRVLVGPEELDGKVRYLQTVRLLGGDAALFVLRWMGIGFPQYRIVVVAGGSFFEPCRVSLLQESNKTRLHVNGFIVGSKWLEQWPDSAIRADADSVLRMRQLYEGGD